MMQCKIPYNHTTIQEVHLQSCVNLENVYSKPLTLLLLPRPTRRYRRKVSLNYLHCPDCESQNIIFHGKSNVGTQKYRCKACGYQFVAQFDVYFPRSRRRELFEKEYLENLAAVGRTKATGRKEFWEGGLQITMSHIESQQMKVRINKMIQSTKVQGELDYSLLLRFIVHEAYVMAMG